MTIFTFLNNSLYQLRFRQVEDILHALGIAIFLKTGRYQVSLLPDEQLVKYERNVRTNARIGDGVRMKFSSTSMVFNIIYSKQLIMEAKFLEVLECYVFRRRNNKNAVGIYQKTMKENGVTEVIIQICLHHIKQHSGILTQNIFKKQAAVLIIDVRILI